MENYPVFMTKLRSIYIFKNSAMKVEEAKFEDLTREVVDTILENTIKLSNESKTPASSRKNKKKFEKNFQIIVEDGFASTMKRLSKDEGLDHVKALNSLTKAHMISFLDKMIPEKSYNGLEELKGTVLKAKPRDALNFIKGIGKKIKNISGQFIGSSEATSDNTNSETKVIRIPLKEPEPEIFSKDIHPLDQLELEARDQLYNIPELYSETQDQRRIPKALRKPRIDEDSMLEEGSHHQFS